MIQVVSELKFPKKTYRLFIGLTSEKNIYFKKFTAWKWNILLITLGSIILSLIVAMWSLKLMLLLYSNAKHKESIGCWMN